VGNGRIRSGLLSIFDTDGDFVRDVTWTLEYNDSNQLTKRYTGTSWSNGSTGDIRWDYTYDDNGNLTQAKKEEYNGGWSETLKWDYEWNPRDQMTRAIKYENGSSNNAGSASSEYPLVRS